MRLGKISQWLTPSYSHCQRCQTTWRFVTPHDVTYMPGRGAFALCEKCWQETAPPVRVNYFKRAHGLRDEWDMIRDAVLAAEDYAQRH